MIIAIIATFNATTGWAGKAIAWDEGVFTLEGHGAVTAADVLKYDGQGHLDRAYAGLQEWVQQVAGVTAAAAPQTQPNEPTATTPPTAERDDPATALIEAPEHGRKASERTDAAKALGMAGDPRAVEPLGAALEDKSKGVHEAAAIALAKIDGPRAVDLLLESSEARRKTRQSVGGRARRAAAKHS